MADMQKRHHRLIVDSIVQGLVDSNSDDTLIRKLDTLGRQTVLVAVARNVAEATAKRLSYTNENFTIGGDAHREFVNDVLNGVRRSLEDARKK